MISSRRIWSVVGAVGVLTVILLSGLLYYGGVAAGLIAGVCALVLVAAAISAAMIARTSHDVPAPQPHADDPVQLAPPPTID